MLHNNSLLYYVYKTEIEYTENKYIKLIVFMLVLGPDIFILDRVLGSTLDNYFIQCVLTIDPALLRGAII